MSWSKKSLWLMIPNSAEFVSVSTYCSPVFFSVTLPAISDNFRCSQASVNPLNRISGTLLPFFGNIFSSMAFFKTCSLSYLPFLGQQPFLALIVQLALQRCGWFLVLGVVVIPPAGRSVAHRFGLSAVEILGNIFLGDFIAARFLSVVFAGNKSALQEIKRSARSDMAYRQSFGVSVCSEILRPAWELDVCLCRSNSCIVYFLQGYGGSFRTTWADTLLAFVCSLVNSRP